LRLFVRFCNTAAFSTLIVTLSLLTACARQQTSNSPSGPVNDWITVNKDYSAQRAVALDEISTATIRDLREICEIRLGEPGWFSSGLLMVGHTIYVDTFQNTYAIDASSCRLRWRHVEQFPYQGTYGNRGPGYLDGTIFRGTADGRVIALDAETGQVRWQHNYARIQKGESFVSAPIGWRGTVYIGIATSEAGIRGHVIAINAKTGKELWRSYTVPAPGEPAAQTWGKKIVPQGGGFWSSYALDPVSRELFAPVANPAPDFNYDLRPGRNLYTNAVLSIDANTGRINWYHQGTVPDEHDWDLGTTPTLYRTRSGANVVAIAGKDGRVLAIDRSTNRVVFNSAVDTLANGAVRFGSVPTRVCPGVIGGAQWNGTAYDPWTDALYVGVVDWCWFYYKVPYREDSEDPKARAGGWADADFSTQPKGWITALDAEDGHLLWRYRTESQSLAGLVPTKGGLVFGGDVRGHLLAFDARTGKLLDSIDTHGALNNGLISYAVGGKQYVAAAVGGITLNSAGVSGPLRIVVYGIGGSATPTIVTLPRPKMVAAGADEGARMWAMTCEGCHGGRGEGFVFPSLARQNQLGDPTALKAFLAYIPPPMPRLYPGLLTDGDVALIARYLKTAVFTHGSLPVYVQPKSSGSAQWAAVYSVLTHPRCINCHTMTDYPRQGDDRHPHIYGVVRGPDDMGSMVARCASCHMATNNAATGIPGRPGWKVAPLSMAWESSPGIPMTGHELCIMLKDPKRNGHRNLAALLDHVETEHLVLWAWDPGTRPNGKPRTKPPLSHAEFVAAFKGWEDAGAPCPD
jgi:alcohol dehydrogenase (cytochrome c)